MKSNLLPAAVVLLSLIHGVPAAMGQSEQPEVSARIDLIAWGESISGLTLKSPTTGTPTTALAFQYSKPISYSGPQLVEIHQAIGSAAAAPAPAAAPENPTAESPEQNAKPETSAKQGVNLAKVLAERRLKQPTLVALAMLPASSRHATILLAPAAGGTYQSYVIDDDPSRLPEGKLRIHNLSPFLIAMRCHESKTSELKTKQSVIVEPRNREVVYELAYQKEGEWVVQENNIATVRENEQAQLVVLKSDAEFFASADGSRSGFLQTVVLRRFRNDTDLTPEMSDAEKAALLERVKREEAEGPNDDAAVNGRRNETP
jgi:hypothetical protein